jgi:hypothetical protein
MINLFKFVLVIVTAIVSYPLGVFAGGHFVGPPAPICLGQGFGALLCTIHGLLNAVVPVLLALGIVYFVWGVVQYVIRSDEEAKKAGKNRMIWGIIGLTVIIGLWGLVYTVVDTFGLFALPPVAPVLIPGDGGGGGICPYTNNPSPKFQDVLGYATCIIGSSIIPFIFALAVVMFVWGVVQYFLLNADEEKKRTQGKMFMIWGIIALAVMISVWSLVAILGDTFGIDTSVLPTVSPSVSP